MFSSGPVPAPVEPRGRVSLRRRMEIAPHQGGSGLDTATANSHLLELGYEENEVSVVRDGASQRVVVRGELVSETYDLPDLQNRGSEVRVLPPLYQKPRKSRGFCFLPRRTAEGSKSVTWGRFDGAYRARRRGPGSLESACVAAAYECTAGSVRAAARRGFLLTSARRAKDVKRSPGL